MNPLFNGPFAPVEVPVWKAKTNSMVTLDSTIPRGALAHVRYFGHLVPEGTQAFEIHPADWLLLPRDERAKFSVFDADAWRKTLPWQFSMFTPQPTAFSFVEHAILEPPQARLRSLEAHDAVYQRQDNIRQEFLPAHRPW